MSGHDGQRDDPASGEPAFDDPAHADLVAELRDLGPVGPMPADVAARLDDVLFELGSQRRADLGVDRLVTARLGETVADTPAEPSGPARVVPLRTRRGPRLLAAAAAVIAVVGGGVGLAQVLPTGSGGDSGMSAAEDAGGRSNAEGESSAPTARDADETTSGADAGARVVLRLSRSDFAATADATSLRNLATRIAPLAQLAEQYSGDGTVPQPSVPESAPNQTPAGGNAYDSLGCTGQAPVPGAATVPILLDGEPALLVILPVADGVRRVEARDCSGTTVLASADLPD